MPEIVAVTTLVFSNTETLFEPKFGPARSGLLSLLKFPDAKIRGSVPTVKFVGVPSIPVPSPSSTERLPDPELATATSGLPSP